MSNVQTYHCHDCDEKDGALVVWRSEDPDVDLCAVLDEVGDGVGPEPFSLEVHGVELLGFALLWEVHEHGGRVQLHQLKSPGKRNLI